MKCCRASAPSRSHQVLERLHEISKTRYVSVHSIALIHAGLRETDEAFRYLERAYRERSAVLAWAKVDPRLDPVCDDARFDDLLRLMGLGRLWSPAQAQKVVAGRMNTWR